MICSSGQFRKRQNRYLITFALIPSSGLSPLYHAQLTRLLYPWDFLGKNTEVGCHFLLQGIFLTQGSNPHLLHPLHWQTVSLPLAPPGKPSVKCVFVNIFSKSVHCLFILSTWAFAEQKLFQKVQFVKPFCLWIILLMLILRTLYSSRSQAFSPI